MGYLYFTLVSALMLLIVIGLMFSLRSKDKPDTGVSQKPKSPGDTAQSPGTIPAAQSSNLKGGKYIPSYQSNPDLAKQVERFLGGTTSRNDNSTAEKNIGPDEGAADEILLEDHRQEHPQVKETKKKQSGTR